jgi:7-carboxy-7-deazaguanine synthase
MDKIADLSLNITETFRSIQGETSYSGLLTSFIRLSQCNLRCTWCDTTYSFSRGKAIAIQDLVKTVEGYGCPYVCITGGEPLLQANVHPLMDLLCDRGYKLSIETGGSLSTKEIDHRVKVILDIKCPGSTMESKNHWENLSYLKEGDEVKFVLLDFADYEYAKSICQKYSLFQQPIELLFSPVHGKLSPRELVEEMLNDNLPASARLNLQLHKYVWDPMTKGV